MIAVGKNLGNDSFGLREVAIIALAVVLVSFFLLYRSVFLNFSAGSIASGKALENGTLDAPASSGGKVSAEVIKSLTAPN